MSIPSHELNEFHKNLVDAKFKAFVVEQLRKAFKEDFLLIENDIQDLLVYGSLREIRARASQKIISRKRA